MKVVRANSEIWNVALAVDAIFVGKCYQCPPSDRPTSLVESCHLVVNLLFLELSSEHEAIAHILRGSKFKARIFSSYYSGWTFDLDGENLGAPRIGIHAFASQLAVSQYSEIL